MLLNSKLNQLPILRDFSDLKRFDEIYSRKYGTCVVNELYQNDVIICPTNQKSKLFELWGYGKKMRISPDDSDISIIPIGFRSTGIKVRPTGSVNGKEMSFSAMKNIMKRVGEIDGVLLAEAADILNMNKKKLISLCGQHEVVIYGIGRKQKIKKNDLIKLNKIAFKKLC